MPNGLKVGRCRIPDKSVTVWRQAISSHKCRVRPYERSVRRIHAMIPHTKILRIVLRTNKAANPLAEAPSPRGHLPWDERMRAFTPRAASLVRNPFCHIFPDLSTHKQRKIFPGQDLAAPFHGSCLYGIETYEQKCIWTLRLGIS